MKLFFLVLARDEKHVYEKIEELERLGAPYLIVSGRRIDHPNIVYREPRGKFDAINFGANLVPRDVDIVALNDVDTKIHNIEAALGYFKLENVGLVFAKVLVKTGFQKFFYIILDSIRRRVLITASGELMLISRELLLSLVPMNPCKAEDSYILFKVLEMKRKVVFCEQCYVDTERTKKAEEEVSYKRRTVCGIYQALGSTTPPHLITVFYFFLPFGSVLLLVLGKKGFSWMKGILLGVSDYLRGDRTGIWQPSS